jgi:hypothetical protein
MDRDPLLDRLEPVSLKDDEDATVNESAEGENKFEVSAGGPSLILSFNNASKSLIAASKSEDIEETFSSFTSSDRVNIFKLVSSSVSVSS